MQAEVAKWKLQDTQKLRTLCGLMQLLQAKERPEADQPEVTAGNVALTEVSVLSLLWGKSGGGRRGGFGGGVEGGEERGEERRGGRRWGSVAQVHTKSQQVANGLHALIYKSQSHFLQSLPMCGTYKASVG